MPATTHSVFVQNVKRRLHELGMTQRDLAVTMGWSDGYVSQLLAGRNTPKLDMPDKIAPALKTTAQYLLTPVDLSSEEKNPASGVDSVLASR